MDWNILGNAKGLILNCFLEPLVIKIRFLANVIVFQRQAAVFITGSSRGFNFALEQSTKQ